MSSVVVVEADKDYRDLNEVMTSPEADRSGLQVKFCELQAKCLAVHTKVPAGLINLTRMAKIRINREK